MPTTSSGRKKVGPGARGLRRRPAGATVGMACAAALALSFVAAAPANADPASEWQDAVLGNGETNLAPVRIAEVFGDVTNADALVVDGDGDVTLTWNGTGLAPTVVVDFGRVITGLPRFNVTEKSSGDVTARLAYSESLPFLLRKLDAHTVVATEAGDRTIHVSTVANAVAGQSVIVGEGNEQETGTITQIGTGAVSNPAFIPIAVGDSRVEVLSTDGYAVGGDLYLGTEREKVTIASIGRASFATVLSQAAPAGATNLKVQANGQQCYEGYGCFGQAAISVGDQLVVGDAAVTVQSVGTPGLTGTGIGVTPLPAAVPNAESVVYHGPGLGIAPVAASSHPSGAAALYPGTGLTLAQPLQNAHALGSKTTTTPGAVVGDSVQFVGTGVASARNRGFTISAPGSYTTPTNQLQGGIRFAALTLTGPGSISVSDLDVVSKFPNYNADSYKGWFQSSDERLNDIWYAGAYTVDTNLARAGDQNNSTVGVILDGAKRDRRIWIGDLYPQALTLFSAFGYGAQGSDFQRESLRVFGQTPGADGRINGDSGAWTAATPTTGFYSTAYSIYFPVNVAEYYRYTGDLDFAKSQYAAMKNQLSWNETLENSSGLVETTAGNDGRDWNYYDGGKPGAVTATNVLYYRALHEAAWIAGELADKLPGDDAVAEWSADAQRWSTKAAATRTAINDQLYDDERGVYIMSTGDNGTHSGSAIPQDANALAILFGVADPGMKQSIFETLRDDLWTPEGPKSFSDDANYTSLISPFATGFETAARFASGDADAALNLIHTVWDRMVDRENPFYTGTTWENYSHDGSIHDSNTSLAHGWSSGPTWQLSSYVLGVTPATAGFKTWRVKPATGPLEWAEGRVPTPHGGIEVSWSQTDRTFTLDVTSPAGTSGEVWVPVSGGLASAVTSGDATFSRHEDGYDVYVVSSDSATFGVSPALVTAEVTPRCLGGKVYLSVSAANVSDGSLSLRITTAYGTKSFANVASGKTNAVSINTRRASIAPGSVSVSAVSSVDPDVAGTVQAHYAAASCG